MAKQMRVVPGKRVLVFLSEENLAAGGNEEYPHGASGVMTGQTGDQGKLALIAYDVPFTKVVRVEGKKARKMVREDYVPVWLLREPGSEHIAHLVAEAAALNSAAAKALATETA